MSTDPINSTIASLTRRIQDATGMRVQTGLFAGMQLPDKFSWGNGDLATKLLGCYEQELSETFADAVARDPDLIVNVGCAEGYYAVGLARLSPRARIVAADVYEPALEICREAAEINGTAARMKFMGRCGPADLAALVAPAERPLVLLDCEGEERSLLLDPPLEKFARTAFVVECHDFADRAITPDIIRRFRDSHTVARIEQGARDPNRYPLLRGWHEHYRWLAMSESRPETMHWLYLVPR